MKTLRSVLVLSAALGISLAAVHAAEPFSVQITKTSSNELINVDGKWRKDLPKRLKLKLRSSTEVPQSNIFFKAYFYDADGNLLRDQKGPNAIWTGTDRGIEEVTFPDVLKPGQLSTVYLALPESVEKMKTLIVVFGEGDTLVCDVYPNSKNAADFSFPEKDKVLKK